MADIKLTPDDLEEMLDNAARRGAKEALRSIGLLDDDAARDIIEMRSLLEAWMNSPSINFHKAPPPAMPTRAMPPS